MLGQMDNEGTIRNHNFIKYTRHKLQSTLKDVLLKQAVLLTSNTFIEKGESCNKGQTIGIHRQLTDGRRFSAVTAI
jgi:hypothetical protein